MKYLLVYLLSLTSCSIFGQQRFHFGIDAGLIMCFTHYNLTTDIPRDNQDIYHEGSIHDPNYMMGFKTKYRVNDNNSLIVGFNYIHKNIGIVYSNKLDNGNIDFSIYGATHNFEIPLIYNFPIAQFKNPDFFITGIIGGSFLLYKYEYSSFFDHSTNFVTIQTSDKIHNSLKHNYSLKTGVMSSSYNSKIGHYEFGANYSFDLLSVSKETLEIFNDQNTFYANFDIHVSFVSLFFRIYLLDYSLFQGRIYRI